MKWTNEDVAMVEKFIEIKRKGYYCDGAQLTNVYNRVLEKSAPNTNCGSCMRARIQELENALLRFKKSLEVDNTSEENKASEDAGNGSPEQPKRKVGRPKKTE